MVFLETLAVDGYVRKRRTKAMGTYHYFGFNQPFIIGILIFTVTCVKSITKSLYLGGHRHEDWPEIAVKLQKRWNLVMAERP